MGRHKIHPTFPIGPRPATPPSRILSLYRRPRGCAYLFFGFFLALAPRRAYFGAPGGLICPQPSPVSASEHRVSPGLPVPSATFGDVAGAS